MRTKKKLSKVVLSLLLAAVMITEPVAGSSVVYASETVSVEITESGDTGEQLPENNEEDNGASESEEAGNERGSENESDDSQAAAEETEADQDGAIEAKDEINDDSGETDSESDDANGTDASAEEEEPLVEDDTIADEKLPESEEPLEEAEETDELDGFSPMPSGYVLSADQMAEKENLAASMDMFDETAEGDLYVEREVFAFADTLEEAEAMAEAYHAEIIKYDMGVVTMKLTEGTSVGKALSVASSMENNLPAVYANYYRYTCEDLLPDSEENSALEVQEEIYETEDIQQSASDEDDIVSQENYEREASAYSDPNLSYKSDYYQWQHVNVGSVYAWNAGYTGSGVKVAVLDTGVSTASGDLALAGSYNAIKGTTDVSDGNGHGTHVAGIIGARSNAIGGAGIAPNASIYGVKVLGDDGSGTDDAVIRGITQAIIWEVDLINMSLGGVGYNSAYQDIITEAYNAGIAVFAAAGNDGGSNMAYPGAFNHVICVAAVDKNNQRAYFSNYGSWVDLSAPGVGIWSTGTSSGSNAVMSGTSQACPVAAGEAAVILQANPSSISGKSGAKRVDALESFMKANAVSVGSGMGKGVTSLTKALKISVASAKPAVPTITATVASDQQSVSITMKAEAGTKIYYTTNGKAPAFKNGVEASGTTSCSPGTTIAIAASDLQAQKGTLQAIAVNASGVSSAVKKVTFTLKPKITSIAISGVSQVAKGKSVQLTATVLPAYATNKKVTWSILESSAKENGVTISTSGKVTASKNATAGTYTVKAEAQDGSGKNNTYKVTVINAAVISSVKFKRTKVDLALPANITSNLGSLLDAKKGEAAATASDFKWTSSNTSIATVDAAGNVTAKAAGSVTITALANDSSGKKATCKVNVKQLVTGISITGDNQVARGKKITLKAAVTPAKATNSKVTWTVVNATGVYEKTDGVTVNNGVVSAASSAKPGTYTVTATAADGSGKSGTKTVTVKDGMISSIAFDKKAETIFRTAGNFSAATSTKITATVKGTDGFAANAYTCTSSNPGIATASATGANGTVTITVTATGKATGKTTVTLSSTDGSNKKAACTVTVNNPVSGINVAPASGASCYVAQGKTLTLKATLEAEFGAISNKKIDWTISGAEAGKYVKISNGKITVGKNATAGYVYTVTATAKDGSKATAQYQVMVTQAGGKIYLLDKYNGIVSTSFVQPVCVYYVYTIAIGCTKSIKGGVSVSSSNPKVISATIKDDYLVICCDKKGSSTITIKANDGSGIAVKYKFRVV